MPPNKLGYCGPSDSHKLFQEFLSRQTGENATLAKDRISKFYALWPYLELIASENGLETLSPGVIEAYWLGNSLLENVRCKELQKTVLSFQKHGLPQSIAKKKASEIPDGMKPHHSMHVLYVNFVSKKVKPLAKNLSSCLVQPAKVKKVSEKTLLAKGFELMFESNELKLKEKEKSVENPFNLTLKPKDLVSLHWGNAIEKITKSQAKSLKSATEETLSLVQA